MFLRKLEEGIRQSSKELFVIHHRHKYDGLFPFWVAIEVTSFGDLSRIYRNLLRETKIKVIEHLKIPPETVASWLHTLSYIRNVCAHYGRLYGKDLVIKPSLTHFKSQNVDNKTTFSIAFILAYFLERNDHINFITTLSGLIEEYLDDIKLSHMGFPNEWQSILMNIRKACHFRLFLYPHLTLAIKQ